MRYDYVITQWVRDERGHFTQLIDSHPLLDQRRRHVEWIARQRSKLHPGDLVSLIRAGRVLVYLIGGRPVTAQWLVADAAARSGARASEPV